MTKPQTDVENWLIYKYLLRHIKHTPAKIAKAINEHFWEF